MQQILYKKLEFAKNYLHVTHLAHVWHQILQQKILTWLNNFVPLLRTIPTTISSSQRLPWPFFFWRKIAHFFACWHEREQSRNQNDSLLLKIDIFHIVLHYIDMSTKRSHDLLQFQKHVYIFECSFCLWLFRLFLDYNLTWLQLSGQKGILPNQKCVVSTELVLAEVAINCTNWCVLLVCP